VPPAAQSLQPDCVHHFLVLVSNVDHLFCYMHRISRSNVLLSQNPMHADWTDATFVSKGPYTTRQASEDRGPASGVELGFGH